MLIIPLILSLITGIFIINMNLHHLYGMKEIRSIMDPERSFIQQGSEVFSAIKDTTASQPEKFKDNAYLQELDHKLVLLNTGIVVRENQRIIYSSSLFDGTNISQVLPEARPIDGVDYGNRHEAGDYREPIILGDKFYLTRQVDFNFPSHEVGSVFMLTDVSQLGQLTRNIFIPLGIAILLILVLTNGILTFLVSRSIVKPLEDLKQAAEQIREGNLDFQINPQGRDEIAKLADAFEEMRYRLKESVEQQLQYEKNRKELISSISHDLKTPITAIKGYVEGIMDGIPGSQERLDQYIKTIYIKSIDLDHLIDELFLFSKLDLKKVPFNYEKVEILAYLQDCFEELQFDMEKNQITLNFYADTSKQILVIADREQLKRAIFNIFQNAIKYMDKEQGEIDLSLRTGEKDVTIKVTDNGQGISPDTLPFIFEQFYRVEPSRSEATGGSGLGLAIAKRIVEEQGGRIWVESDEGKGTSLYFTLRRA
jgi:signal transduction histidine kinase